MEEMNRLTRGLVHIEAREGVASGQDPHETEFLMCELKRGLSHCLHLEDQESSHQAVS